MSRMSKALPFVAGAGMGAAAMYFFDPRLGATRRASVQEKLGHYARAAGDAITGLAQEAVARAFGTVMELRYQLDRRIPPDHVLEARVKSRLGRIVANPGSVTVSARDGEVTLSGPILTADVDRTLMGVRLIPGVTHVVNHLDAHPSPDSIPGLQTDHSARAGSKG
jgi:osmotically-inducible protein OsmY